MIVVNYFTNNDRLLKISTNGGIWPKQMRGREMADQEEERDEWWGLGNGGIGGAHGTPFKKSDHPFFLSVGMLHC